MMRTPRTNAKMPSPSANTAPRMKFWRITFAASGFRPIAVVVSPVRIPIPMPGPMIPRAAMPAPMSSILSPSMAAGHSTGERSRTTSVGGGRVGRSRSGLRPRLVLLVVVPLDGDEREHERQDAEHERLHEADEQLEAQEGDRRDRDEQARHDAEDELAAVDVGEEPE